MVHLDRVVAAAMKRNQERRTGRRRMVEKLFPDSAAENYFHVMLLLNKPGPEVPEDAGAGQPTFAEHGKLPLAQLCTVVHIRLCMGLWAKPSR